MNWRFCVDTPEQRALYLCGKMDDGDGWSCAGSILGEGYGDAYYEGYGNNYGDGWGGANNPDWSYNDDGTGSSPKVWR